MKRVWGLRECLQEIQLDNESSERLKRLLLETLMCTQYLKMDEVSFLCTCAADHPNCEIYFYHSLINWVLQIFKMFITHMGKKVELK